jgi:hypothetical protein
MDTLPATYTLATGRAAGLTRAHLRTGPFVRISHDLVVRPDDAIDARERLAVLATALPPDVAYSHGTAAHVLGAHLDLVGRPHVALTPRRVLPQRSDIVVHARRLAPEDVVVAAGLRVTSATQTFLDLAAVLPPAELVAVGDALLRAGRMTPESIQARLERAGQVRGVVRARACAPLLSAASMSRPESLVRYFLVASHLPDPEVQVPVLDRAGRTVAHSDLGYRRWKLLLEYEGRQHADADRFAADVDRYSLMAADGYLLLRFAARHLNARTVVDRTERALLSRGWRPTPPAR